jgi:S1-C subfamily serine protease
VVPQLIEHGQVVRPQLGIAAGNEWALRRAGIEGVLIMSVAPSSPAHRAGLRGTYRAEDGTLVLGDVIQGIDGRTVASIDDLYAALEQHSPGDVVKLKILREGRALEVEVKLEPARQ